MKQSLASQFFALVLALFGLSACGALPITCRVLDRETNTPIEGAVAIAFWDVTRGVGFVNTETVAVWEGVTNKDGFFTVPSVSVPAAAHVRLKVYKFGYVGWDNTEIYLGNYADDVLTPRTEKRTDFEWRKQDIFLEKFKKEYSYVSHYSFIETELAGVYFKSNLFENAIQQEIPSRANERRLFDEKRNR